MATAFASPKIAADVDQKLATKVAALSEDARIDRCMELAQSGVTDDATLLEFWKMLAGPDATIIKD
jgi:hypothetical protein